MSTLDIRLRDDLKTFLDDQIARRGYKDASEFLEALLEAEKLRSIREELEHSLVEATRQPSTPLTAEDFRDIEREGLEILKRRKMP